MWILSKRLHQKPAALDPRFYKKDPVRLSRTRFKSYKSIACLKYIVPYFTLWMLDFFNTIQVSNSLDPDQAQHYDWPDLGPNCLQRLSTDNKSRPKGVKSKIQNYLLILLSG